MWPDAVEHAGVEDDECETGGTAGARRWMAENAYQLCLGSEPQRFVTNARLQQSSSFVGC